MTAGFASQFDRAAFSSDARADRKLAIQMTAAQVPAPATTNMTLKKIAASIGERVHGEHIVDNSGTKPPLGKISSNFERVMTACDGLLCAGPVDKMPGQPLAIPKMTEPNLSRVPACR